MAGTPGSTLSPLFVVLAADEEERIPRLVHLRGHHRGRNGILHVRPLLGQIVALLVERVKRRLRLGIHILEEVVADELPVGVVPLVGIDLDRFDHRSLWPYRDWVINAF